MNKAIDSVIEALNSLEKGILKASTENGSFNEINSWNYPPLSGTDLANLAKNISARLKENEIQEIDEHIGEQLEIIPVRIKSFMVSTLPHLFNGNGHQSIPNYFFLIQWITNTVEPLFGWQILQDNKALPGPLNRQLRSIQSQLNELIPKKEELLVQIALIKNATEAAETLPTDLESLKEARQKVNKFFTDSAELFGKIDTYYKSIETTSQKIHTKKDEADKLVAQCEEAYKITTTKGLAGAFDQRAERLSTSMWFWVFGLFLALGVGICIGSHRFEVLNIAMSTKTQVGYVWIQIFLSILSLGAPVWFAWIATKQISQRFKLSEDYAFKASVAKAYEGYRKEAARIDEGLEIRLFTSALTRLEEAPLRLMETEHHGSPWHELFTSPQFKSALDIVPGLRDKSLSILKPTTTKSKNDSVEEK